MRQEEIESQELAQVNKNRTRPNPLVWDVGAKKAASQMLSLLGEPPRCDISQNKTSFFKGEAPVNPALVRLIDQHWTHFPDIFITIRMHTSFCA
jgi:hypothetical protein